MSGQTAIDPEGGSVGSSSHVDYAGCSQAIYLQGEEAVIEPTRLLYVFGLAALFLPTILITIMDFYSGNFKIIYPALMILIFSPLILRTLWLAINLPPLILTPEGVAIPGGWIRRPQLLRWDDIREFGVYLSLSQQFSWDPGPLMRVGFNYRPEAEPKFDLLDMPAWGSHQRVVPSFYAVEPDSVAERLNACRKLVLAQTEQSPC